MALVLLTAPGPSAPVAVTPSQVTQGQLASIPATTVFTTYSSTLQAAPPDTVTTHQTGALPSPPALPSRRTGQRVVLTVLI